MKGEASPASIYMELTDDERDKILQVIQRDFTLRENEKKRLKKIEDGVTSQEQQKKVLCQKENFNEDFCPSCCRAFGYIFNRKQICLLCHAGVCKSCSHYSYFYSRYICHVCVKRNELHSMSLDWFYSKVSKRFKSFGSAKVVRALYKKKSSLQKHVSDSDLHNPSQSSTDPSTHPFDILQNHDLDISELNSSTSSRSLDRSNHESYNHLPQSPSLDNLSATNLSKAKSLDSISGDILPPRQYTPWNLPIRDISKVQDLHFTNQSSTHARNNGPKIFQTKDIYKEAFENTRKIEEKKFRVKFDALLCQMQQALEKQSQDDQSNISFGDIMVNYRSHIRELFSDLSQRLQLAIENYLEEEENSAGSTQKVKQIVSRLVEDHLGESVDLTSDEAVSDLSSLSDDSFEGHHSYEDQLAQVVVSKVIENQRLKELTYHSGPLDKNSIIPNYPLPQENLTSQTVGINLKTPNRPTSGRKPLIPKFVEEHVVTYEQPIQKSVVDHTASANMKAGSSYDLFCRPLNKGINLDDVILESTEIDPDYLSLNLTPIKETADEEESEDEESVGFAKIRDQNWILRKLNTKTSIEDLPANHSVLVPQPEEILLPQIGDKNADDLSDLSENDDIEFEDNNPLSIVNNIPDSVPKSIETIFNSSFQTVPNSKSLSLKTGISKTKDEVDSPKLKNAAVVKREPKPVEKSILSETGDPKFEIPPESTISVEGEALNLNCRVTGTEPIDIFWYHIGAEVVKLEDGEKYEIKKDEFNRHVLTVYHPSKDDVGQYMCIAINDVGKCSEYFIVTINKNTQPMKIPELLKKFDDIEVREGQLVRFRCKVKGYPPPRITWYKDGRFLRESGNLKLEKFGNRDYSLSIDNATLDDDAEYCVVGRNLTGEVRHSAQLIVEPMESFNKVEGSERRKDTKMTTSSPIESGPTKGQLDARNGSVEQKSSEVPCKREEKHIENLSRKMTQTKDKVSHVAEDMLQSADEMTLIQHHLEFMDRTLTNLENNLPQHVNPLSNDEDSLNNNEEIAVNDVFAQKVLAEYHIQDTVDHAKDVSEKKQDVSKETEDEAGIEPTIVDHMFTHRVLSEHHEQKMAAEKMRKVTSTALGILEKAELAVLQQKDTENNIIPTNDYNNHLNSDDLDDPTLCYPINELSSVTESKDKLDSTDQLNIVAEAEPEVVAEQKHENKEPSTLAPYSSGEFLVDFSSCHEDPILSKPAEVTYNYGLKPVDAERFKKEFYVNPPKKVNPNKSSNPSVARSRDIVKSKHEVEDTEDKIYMAACGVYSLEDKIQQLEAQVGDIHEGISYTNMSALEDEVAKAMAGVEHSENEVVSIEKSVEKLQNTLELQTASPQHMSAGINTVFNKDYLKTPQRLVGESQEKDIPASRTEFDSKTDIELPSVNRLRAMFNQPTRNNLGDSSVKRTVKLDPMIHSITARSLSKTQMEDLKYQQNLTGRSGMSTISLDGKSTQRQRPSLKTIPAPQPPGGTDINTIPVPRPPGGTDINTIPAPRPPGGTDINTIPVPRPPGGTDINTIPVPRPPGGTDINTIPTPRPPGGTDINTKSTKRSLAPIAPGTQSSPAAAVLHKVQHEPAEMEKTCIVKGGIAAKASFWENVVKKSNVTDTENQPVFSDLVGEEDA